MINKATGVVSTDDCKCISAFSNNCSFCFVGFLRIFLYFKNITMHYNLYKHIEQLQVFLNLYVFVYIIIMHSYVEKQITMTKHVYLQLYDIIIKYVQKCLLFKYQLPSNM